jgi:uncharacterized protein Yka (UPF0111/DUF47 family)
VPDPILFEAALDNRGLFADHYLTERFPQRDDVQSRQLSGEADAAFEQVRTLFRQVADEVHTWNEAQTEDRFVQPILKEVLGWSRNVQPHVQRQGRVGRPDYALFTSEERRATAVDRAGDDGNKVFDYADAVVDAKYWGRPLDGTAPDPSREKRAEMRRNNPSFQIIDYVTLTGVEWGILTNGARWRLYYEGAPSRLETYFEVNLPEIVRLATGTEEEQEAARDAFRLFYALFRADAHRPTVEGEKFVDVVYEASDTYAEALEDTLKERVFDHVFLELATGLYENHRRTNGTDALEQVLDDVYRATLRLLYRLLFLLYAESRGLLPLDTPGYYDHSLTRLARRAKEEIASGRTLSERHTDFWNDLDALFRTIDEGDPAFDVPAYNGGLFRRDHDANTFLDTHEIGQRYVARALVNLTAVDPETDPTGPSVDYTSFDVRQLGSIYEGLLEHRLVVTDDDTLDLRTDDGERKETGSYYTPHYIVEYIVEETLGPIVDERIEQFEAAMDEITDIVDGRDPDDPGVQAKLDAPRRQALDAFLTVRVCDPAMGSGHFLVVAADYLAERFAQVLGRFPDHNPVTQRLDAIRTSILDELDRQGVDIDGMEEDNRLRDTSLLKRLVVKRCIYGVDLNPMAVELAKLSLWLHSFTVGAPLSFLDHHLKTGNSLIGTRVDTVVEEIQADLFGNVRDEILRGTKFLQDAAFNTDATLADVEQSAEAFRTYQDTMRPYKRLLDLWTAQHFDHEMGRTLVRDYAREVIEAYRDGEGAVLEEYNDTVDAAERLADAKRVFHWELEFPEVFYELEPPGDRDNPGFDAVIGNPPYGYRVTGEIDDYLDETLGKAESENIAEYFVERCFRVLKRSSDWGMIIPKQVLHTPTWSDVRTTIHGAATSARTIIDVSEAFREVLLEQVVVLASAEETERVRAGKITDGEIDDSYSIASRKLTNELWPIYAFDEFEDIYERIHSVSDLLGDLADLYFGVKNIKPKLTRSTGIPMITGDNITRYGIVGEPPCLPEDELREKWKKKYLIPKLVVQRIVAHVTKPYPHIIIMASNDKEGRLAFDTTTVVRSQVANYSDDFLLAVINSRYTSWYLHRFVYNFSTRTMGFRDGFADKLPIRDIDFTTPDDEHEQHVEALMRDVEAAQGSDAPPADAAVLDAVDDHLSADPERADVVHDLLAHLARTMTQLKEERHTYHLDITDYVADPDSGRDGSRKHSGLRQIGRYQPAPGATTSLLADTTTERDGLRIGTLSATQDDDTVQVRATARFKPDGPRESWPGVVPDDAEPDRWGYVETAPLSVCALHDCSEAEAGLVVHWLDALNDADSGFSGYRDTATKTIPLLDRIYDIRFPDPDYCRDALGSFLRNAAEAAELDREIAFTDGLIDQIVYRLYGLSEDGVGVVEENS